MSDFDFNQYNNSNYWKQANDPQDGSAQGDDSYELDPGKSLSATAAFLGVASIATSFFTPFGVPLVLAVLSIVLAILSTGKNTQMKEYSRRALKMGLIGLLVHCLIMCGIGITGYKMVTDPEMRVQANKVMQQMYGYSLDSVLQTIDENYGTDLLHADGSSK